MTRRSAADRAAYRSRIHAYLRSDVWHHRSRVFRAKRGWRCTACGAVSKRNHAHHLTYVRAFSGREPDSDLRVLCPPCHSWVHDYDRSHSGTLQQNSLAAIALLRKRSKPRRKGMLRRLLQGAT